ncbi:MAG: hypothetical protein Q7R35_13815 [Elusimicrobiota bacterium]|nr:hypothetical protein [Elusimicrobiota bacterium]
MKKELLFISWLLLVIVPYHAAMAAEASSFESQLLEAHKTIMSQAASAQKEFISHTATALGSKKEPRIFVEMYVSWGRPGELSVTEQNLKLNVLGDRNWSTSVIVFTGDLKATARPIFPTDSSNGYHLKGPDMDISITRAGPVRRGYFIQGTYKMPDKTKPIYLTIYLAPTDDGWDTVANNMSLRVSNEGYGSLIKGYINQNGKPELGILGACLGAVRYFSQ